MKLAVGYPWYSPFIWTATADSLLGLNRPEGVEVKFFRGGGWSPARRHMHICEQALQWGADLVCIVGSDQVYEEDLLERLIARHREGYEVVSALVPCRGYFDWQDMKPFQPMAWRLKKSNRIEPIKTFEGQAHSKDMIEYIRPEDGDMQPVNFIGSGVLMFHRDHLGMLDQPWFFERVNHETQIRTASMDSTFVWRLQMEAHAKVWVDTTIKVKHLHAFEVDDTFQDRFADWAEGGGDPNVCLYQRGPHDSGIHDPASQAPANGGSEGRGHTVAGDVERASAYCKPGRGPRPVDQEPPGVRARSTNAGAQAV